MRVDTIVHCDCGFPTSGGENVHNAKTADRNVAQDEALKSIHTAKTAARNVTQDETPKPGIHTAKTAARNVAQDEAPKPADNVHSANTVEKNVTQDEALKPADIVDFAGYNLAGCYRDASKRLRHTEADNVHTANTVKRNVTQDEAPKPADIIDFAGYKWLKDLNTEEYRKLAWETECDHCKTPWRLGPGPPLSCKGSLEGKWTCSECAEIVETGYYCTKGYPLYVCGTVIPGTQLDRTDMFVEYNERMQQNCIENEEKREVDQMTDAYSKVGNTSKIAMEATIPPEQRADRSLC